MKKKLCLLAVCITAMAATAQVKKQYPSIDIPFKKICAG